MPYQLAIYLTALSIGYVHAKQSITLSTHTNLFEYFIMLYPLLKLCSVAWDVEGLLRTVDREGCGKVNVAYV
jgi:hypothetical protein